MPSIVPQRKKLDVCSQPVSVVHTITDDSSSRQEVSCEGLPIAPGVSTSSSSIPTFTGMTSTPVLQRGHPIDELTHEPVDLTSRPTQHLHPESSNSNSSTDFGPFVSGLSEEPRQRSSSFNASVLRHPRLASKPTQHVGSADLRRCSESQAVMKTGSAEDVGGQRTSNQHGQLVHSHTVPEMYTPHALSNDSGYNTPPFRQANPGHNTSPPWHPNMYMAWPAHVSPPVQPTTQDKTSSMSTMRPLTVETDHYQPEPSPQLVLAHPAPYYMHPGGYNSPTAGYFHQRSHEHPPGSLQPQVSSSTPEEGVCGFQRERKQRLEATLESAKAALDKLKAEGEQLSQKLRTECEDSLYLGGGATEREVENMEVENKKLHAEVSNLSQRISELENAPVAYVPNQVVHVGLPTIAPTPAPRGTSPSRPVTAQPLPNSPSNSVPQAPARPPPPIPPPRPPLNPQDNVVDESQMWSCSQCTLLNHPDLSVCEVCETPRPRSGTL